MLNALRAKLGLDGAVAYTFLARLINIVGSTGTVLLIVRVLGPTEQGYYYTLLSLVSLQLIFELGFSFVIQQLAAHECVHLDLHTDGSVTGDRTAHARLASALQLSLRWYTLAALAMATVLMPLGTFFFAHHAAGATPVAWHGPWLSAALASAVGLWCMPFYSFLEGCGHIRSVAAMRLRQAVATSVLAWGAMLLHHGLYAPALVIVGQIGTGLVFLLSHRRLLSGLLKHPTGSEAIHWTGEVWPFQWRIAVSWMCSYFTVQVFIPILFALRGPVEAGQMGMSLSITGYMTVLTLAWSSTKITPFGRMIARRAFHDLDDLFLRTLRQSLAVFATIAMSAVGMSALLAAVAPRLASRMLSPPLFAILVLGAGANCIVQSLATLLRSFKREPFLVQSLVVASLTLVLAAVTAPRWGDAGAALSYLIATAIIGLPIAWLIFTRTRRGYLAIAALPILQSEAR
jgi:O-antigen/teichoic acid export membrane protein